MKKSEIYEQKLLDALRVAGRVDLADAEQLLDVSESTVRRLFTALEGKNGVIRVHGAIQLEGMASSDYRFDRSEEVHSDEKRRIAAFGVQLVEEGDVLYLDSGTTLAQMCARLAAQLREKPLSITVFTNSIVNLELLGGQADISLIGGKYRANRRDFCGYIAEETVKNLHFTKAFLGTDGFNAVNGFTATDFSTARLNQLVLGRTDKSVILADSSKFETSEVVSYSRGSKVDLLITDRRLPEEKRRGLRGHCSEIRFL